ncbi:MAG: putative histidine transporter YuiF (NhaC family) [Paraglaciecola sp.]|jgi:predicted histidine transporter YuiF (NhaC family)
MDFSLIWAGLAKLTDWLSSYYSQVAMTIVATMFIVYGDVVNKRIKKLLAPYHFIIRTLAFVLICAFGYGALILFATPHVKLLILQIPSLYRGLSVVLMFLLLGYLAENRRYI